MPRYAIIQGALVENVIVADTAPTIPGRTVVLLAAGQAVGPGDSYNGSVFTPYVPTAVELLRRDAPGKVKAQYLTLRQWATDAQATYDAATTGNRALTAAEQREFIRRMGKFLDGVADLLLAQGFDQ
jgi:hypothetical protein